MMQTSDRGLYALALHEGVVPAPYIDAVGVWTFGIGHAETSGLDPNPRNMPRGMPADQDAAIRESFRLFRGKIGVYEAAVERAVTVALSQHEFDALVSFQFNTGAIGRASLTRRLNEGDRRGAADGLRAWNKGRVNGKLTVLDGLTRRREEERAMFLNATYPSAPIPIYDVTPSNRVGRAIGRMTQPEAMALLRGAPREVMPAAPEPTAAVPREDVNGWLARLIRFVKGDA